MIHYFKDSGGIYSPDFRTPFDGEFRDKPQGGLWACRGNEWHDWCSEEMPQWVSHGGFTFDLSPRASVYQINSEADLPFCRYDGDSFRLVWSALIERYDAIEVTPDGYSALKFTDPGLYGWFVPSLVITNPDQIINVKHF